MDAIVKAIESVLGMPGDRSVASEINNSVILHNPEIRGRFFDPFLNKG